jgi:hypothetical protein
VLAGQKWACRCFVRERGGTAPEMISPTMNAGRAKCSPPALHRAASRSWDGYQPVSTIGSSAPQNVVVTNFDRHREDGDQVIGLSHLRAICRSASAIECRTGRTWVDRRPFSQSTAAPEPDRLT